MTSDPDLRWRQRYQHFSSALTLLGDALRDGSGSLSLLEQQGVVQRFEFTFELAWKTLKDYLEHGGIIVTPLTPRQVIKEGFSAQILPDGQLWINMLDHRNLLSHTYDNGVFEAAVVAISDQYLPALRHLHEWLTQQLPPS